MGYEVQIAETCHEASVAEVIAHVAVSSACGQDGQVTIPTLKELGQRGQQPEELVADTAYGSADYALEAERLGTELVSPVAGSAPVIAIAFDPASRRPTRSWSAVRVWAAWRVRGQPRVVLAVHLKARACNVKRLIRALIPRPEKVAPEMV